MRLDKVYHDNNMMTGRVGLDGGIIDVAVGSAVEV